MHISFNTAILFWDFYLKEMLAQVYKDTCTRVFPTALFVEPKKYEKYLNVHQ